MMRSQFLLGVGAQAYQRVVTIGAQLVVLPVMLYGWGPAVYGGWVALDSLRTVLSMTDLGLAQIAANQMTAEVAAGRREEARRIASVAWVMIGVAALVIMVLAALAALFLPIGPFLNIDQPPRALGLAFFLLSAVAAISVLFGVTGGVLRAEGMFWLMSASNANYLLATAVAMAVCALVGGSYVGLAASLVGLAGVNYGAVTLWTLWRYPWARPRLALVEGARIRGMLGPSLAYMLYTLTNLVTIQGVNILVAALLGPVALTALSAIRTVTRLGRAVASVIIYPLEPIFAQLAGQADPERAQTLYRKLMWGGAGLALAFGVPMAVFGPAFLDVWTRGAVVGHDRLHILMTAAIVVEILWFALQTPYVATNRHSVFAQFVASAGVGSTVACGVLLPILGLDAAGWTLLAMQIAILIQTVARSRNHPPEGSA